MTLPTKRGYARIYYDAPILYAIEKNMEEYHGIMHNCSVDGMHFVSRQSLSTGDRIKIKVANKEADGTVPIAYDGYYATVAWCEPVADSSLYGVGVRFFRPEKNRQKSYMEKKFKKDDMEASGAAAGDVTLH